MEWLADNPWVAWLGLTLVLGAIEAATVDLTFLMLSGGALAGAGAAALGLGFSVQVIVALATAVLLLFVVRPIAKRRFMDNEVDHGIGTSALVGRQAWVLQTVTETDGRVKLAGSTWSARVPAGVDPVEPGREVTVLSLQGATAIVAATAGDV